MKIKLIDVAGLSASLDALHLPYGKGRDLSPDGFKRDMGLLKKLIEAGDEHAKVLRGVVAWIEITAPIYFFREMETYRVGRERLSCTSTMHIECKGLKGEELQAAKAAIAMGREQTAIDMISYQALRRIYLQRRHHRLPEWKEFCKFLEENLPYFNELILPCKN